MSTSPDAPAFGALDYPRIGRAAADDAAAAERGYAAGLARARHRAERDRARVLAALEAAAAERDARRTLEHRTALDALAAARRAVLDATVPVLRDADRALARAALELAEAVIGAELDAGPDGAARRALQRVLDHPVAELVVRVRLHPQQLAALAGSAPEGLELVPDASLAPGDAVAELPDGLIDARLGSALDRARRALEEAR